MWTGTSRLKTRKDKRFPDPCVSTISGIIVHQIVAGVSDTGVETRPNCFSQGKFSINHGCAAASRSVPCAVG